MKCPDLEQLHTEAFAFICGRLTTNKFVVIRRIEREHVEGMLESNGKMIAFFDSPSRAVKFARDNFARAYQGKTAQVLRPTSSVPRDIGDHPHAATMTIKVILEANGGIDSVKYVIYLMRPEDIAKLMLRTEEVFYDLAAFPGQLVELPA